MIETGATLAELPSPAEALEARFRGILQRQMQDMPMLNRALRVQAVGFRRWDRHWLGVLITPWFMNLLLIPRARAQCPAIGERESRHYVFPAGVFEFIGSRDTTLGDYQSCSLFSPMFEFADHDSARATAEAALQALFDAGNRPTADLPAAPTEPLPAAARPAGSATPVTPLAPALRKRDALFGPDARTPRGA